MLGELLAKLLVPLKLSAVLLDPKVAPPHLLAELLAKLLPPLKLSTLLLDAKVTPPHMLPQLLKKLLVSSAVLLDAPPNLA